MTVDRDGDVCRKKNRGGCVGGHGGVGGGRPDQMQAMTSLARSGQGGTAGSAMGYWTGVFCLVRRECWAVMGLISSSTLPLMRN